MTARVFSWDYRGQPDMASLAAVVTELSANGQVFMREVETGTDSYAVAVSDAELTDEQALSLYLGEDDAEPGDRPVEVIFAPGRRVRYAHPGNGYPGDAEQAARLLAVGEIYVIDWADIGFAKTRLSLDGIDSHGQGFNSVLFDPVADEEAGR